MSNLDNNYANLSGLMIGTDPYAYERMIAQQRAYQAAAASSAGIISLPRHDDLILLLLED